MISKRQAHGYFHVPDFLHGINYDQNVSNNFLRISEKTLALFALLIYNNNNKQRRKVSG